jgi:hypothetical protein
VSFWLQEYLVPTGAVAASRRLPPPPLEGRSPKPANPSHENGDFFERLVVELGFRENDHSRVM